MHCELMKACQPLWTAWAGIEEAVCRITVAGGGKSILDGSFGQMSAIMNSASDMGHGYQNAREVLEAIGHSLGMAATRFLAFKPDRDYFVVTAKLHTFEESTLCMELDPYNLSLTGFKYSGYGRGYPIHHSNILLFRSPALPKAKKDLPDKGPVPGSFEFFKKCEVSNIILAFLDQEFATSSVTCMVYLVLLRLGVPAVTLNCLALNPLNGFAPRCIEVVDGSSVKAEVATSKATGESQTAPKTATCRHNQAIHLQNRANRFEVSLEVERCEKRIAGILLWDVRCPLPGRHCTCEYLKVRGFSDCTQHVAAGTDTHHI